MPLAPRPALLTPYRALDLTDVQGYLCSRILGDMGCDVIKVEPPGGDPGRMRPPFYHDTPDNERSLYWMTYNANKRGVTLDVEKPEGRALFKRLVDAADFVIESFPPGHMDRLGLSYWELQKVNPGVVLTSVTPFGQDGPYRDYKATDIVNMALSGVLYVTGDRDRPPVRVSFAQSYLHAGAEAAAASLFAHYWRELTGEGQHVDVSIQESMVWTLMNVQQAWDMSRSIVHREGSARYLPATGARLQQHWPCADGYVSFVVMGGSEGVRSTRAMVAWLDEEGLASEAMKSVPWEEIGFGTQPQEELDKLHGPIGKLLLRYTKKELYAQAVRRGVIFGPVNTARDILEDPQLQARGFWQQVEQPELGGQVTYPGPFIKMSATPLGIWRLAPRVGEHNRDVYERELGLSRDEFAALRSAGVV